VEADDSRGARSKGDHPLRGLHRPGYSSRNIAVGDPEKHENWRRIFDAGLTSKSAKTNPLLGIAE